MEHLLSDLRRSLRQLVRDPRTSLLIVVCAALGIGLNSSIFTLVNAFLLRSPGIEQPERLARLFVTFPGFDYASFSYLNYRDAAERNEVFTHLAASGVRAASLGIGGESERVAVNMVSGDYFPALGVHASRGRLLSPSDNETRGGHGVAVISHHLWQSRFGGKEGVVGTKILVNATPFEIVGIAAQGFTGTLPGFQIGLWVPLEMQPAVMPTDPDLLDQRGSGWLSVFGRLRPGVTVADVQANFDVLASQMKAERGDGDKEWGFVAHSGYSQIPPRFQKTLYASSALILLVVFCVLLIACSNVASLLLARAEARQREMSIRLAIGAGRTRLVVQLLTESLVLAAIGGVLGTLLAFATARAFPALIPSFGVPVTFDVPVDHRVLVYTLGLTLVTGCLFGLVPALQASRPDLVTALKGETRGRRRAPLRKTLVAFQVALSLLLLVAAGLFIRSLRAEREVDPGFLTGNLLVAQLDPSLHGYDAERGLDLFLRIQEQALALPGVRSATLGQTVPLAVGNQQQWGIEVEGYTPAKGERMNPEYNVIAESYFETMGIPLVAGRGFEPGDGADGRPVIIVNRAMAERYWEGGDAVGRRVHLGGEWREVVGIAETSKYLSLREDPQPHMYLPIRQIWKSALYLHLRTAGDPLALVPALRAAVRKIDPNLPLYNVRTMEQQAEQSLFLQQMGAKLIGSFGGLALVMAAVGLFGLLSHGVAARTREIGIRMSIGATRRDVFAQLLKEGLLLTSAGLAAGLATALVASRFLSKLLYGLEGTDPATFAAVTGILVLTSVVAVAFPSLKATRVDPVVALRYE